MLGRLLPLIAATILVAACGSSGTPAANVPAASGAATQAINAPTSPPGGGGGGATAGIPAIADGAYKSGTAHVEVSGARSETFDVGLATGITTAGNTVLAFVSADNQKIVQLTFLAPGSPSPGAVSVTTAVGTSMVTAAGTLGQECQVKITRNNASGVSGEFSCNDAPGLAGITTTKANMKGTFSADR